MRRLPRLFDHGGASISALINPETIIIAGNIVRGAPLAIDVLRKRLNGNVYDPPRIVLSELGLRDVVHGSDHDGA